jgi:predicted amidohydrolase
MVVRLVATTARAIESQCYVIAAAQFGRHNEKRESYGHSLVIDPWGKIVADAGGCDGPGTVHTEAAGAAISTPSIISCDVDLELLTTVRERMPVQKHRESASFHATPDIFDLT